jgi:hypothetical protein
MKTILTLLSCLLLSSCTKEYITVYTDYLSHQNLASYHVGTPDPCLDNPPIGQRLHIAWSLPKEFLCKEDLYLNITIRFRNKQELNKQVLIDQATGTYIYTLINEEYFKIDGILTYKVDLFANDEIIVEWRHQLWTELLLLNN